MIKVLFLCVMIITKAASLHVNEKTGHAQSFIFGGTEVIPHSIPYQVFLFTYFLDSSSGKCGGSIISHNYILTAKHCVDENFGPIKFILIILGAHDIRVREPQQVWQHVTQEHITLHALADAALVRTMNAIAYTSAIQPIVLPQLRDKQKDYVGHNATASGWGENYIGERYKLRAYSMQVIPNSNCILSIVTPFSMCIKGSRQSSVCEGDSGGPLTIGNKNGEPMLIGISAQIMGITSKKCAESFPTGYTSVGAILDWIKENSDAPIDV